MDQNYDKEVNVLINDIKETFYKNEKEKPARANARQLYALVYELYNKMGGDLFKQITPILDEFCDVSKKEIKNVKADEDIIDVYETVWIDYIGKCNEVDRKLSVLNKKEEFRVNLDYDLDAPMYIFEDRKRPIGTINEYVRERWSVLVLDMKDKLAGAVFENLKKERNGESQQRENRTRAIIESFIECDKDDSKLYSEALEKPIIEQVERHYKKLSEGLASSKSSEEYFTTSYNHLQKERSILEKNLPLSVEKIYRAAWNCLISDRLNIIKPVVKSFVQLENERDNLKKCFVLMSETIETLNDFCTEFEKHEENMFLELRRNTEDGHFCEKFIERYEERDKVIKSDFNSNTAVRKAFDNAIEKVLNMSPKKENGENNGHNSNVDMPICKTPNIVANYCDHFLKNGTRGLSDVELEKKLDGAMTMFKYMKDKDIFNRLYTKHLAVRLIDSSSQSIDTEQAMLAKLKNECGNDYVTRPEKMIKDYKVSSDETMAFKKTSNNSMPFSFDIMILQSGSWPVGATRSGVLVPEVLEKGLQNFNNFYVGKFNGRKLLWNHDLSSCEVKFNCLKKTYTVHMSVTTLTILMTFNTNESITSSDLASMTGIELDELSKFLRYLVKEKILLCEDDDIVEQSTITLNDKYENKRSKFKLKPQLRDQNREVEQTLQSVQSDRKFFLQALIVRIMKGSKTMAHRDLVNEVIKLSVSNFVPSVSFIKKTISYLIEKEYMESKNNVYHYLA